MERYDYVIVGAGSAGCVLANRLSADPDITVALLEAGPRDNNLNVRMPAGVSRVMANKNAYNWGFWTEPQAHLNGRKLFWPRGRGWGGSSSINGMVYIRGHARDYDQWRQLGLEGWGYRDVLPYFKRAEHNQTGADAWHGQGGPLWVSPPEPGAPTYNAFVEAGAEAGYPVTRDFNGFQQEGVGPYALTIRDGERWSASAAYLRPIVGVRPNLAVISNARALGLILERGCAIGVDYARGRTPLRVYAKREVIVASGAVQSPHLLLHSGIGPAEQLRKHNVPIVHDLPGVGANLQDHLDVSVLYEVTKPVTVYSMIAGGKQLTVGLDYMFRKSGPGRTNHLHAGAFLKTRGEYDRPDVQLHFVNALMRDHARIPPDRDGFTIHACQLRPESRGEIRLASRDPMADPVIDPRYLSTDNEMRTLRDSVRMVRDICSQEALDLYRGPEMAPGASVQSDADIDGWIRAAAETIYHPVGTCRMGNDAMAVTDAQLRVRGIDGLRVVDASVMPTLIGGNTNAPTIMIAEKAADMMLGSARLPPQDAPIAEDERSV